MSGPTNPQFVTTVVGGGPIGGGSYASVAPSGGGGGGPTWIPLSLSDFTASSDSRASLSGPVVDNGGGSITWPMIAADETFQDLKVSVPHTMSFADLATLTGAEEADIISGATALLVHMKVTEIQTNVQIFAGFVDNPADPAGAIDGAAGGVLSQNGTHIKAAWVTGVSKGLDNTYGTAIADGYAVVRLQCTSVISDKPAILGQVFGPDDDGVLHLIGSVEEANNSGVGTLGYFTVGTMFITNSGTAGDTTVTIHVAAVPVADLYYETVP